MDWNEIEVADRVYDYHDRPRIEVKKSKNLKKKSRKKLIKKIEDLEAQVVVDTICIENWEKRYRREKFEDAFQLVSDIDKILGAVAMSEDLCDYKKIKAARITLDDIDESLQSLRDRFKYEVRAKAQLY